MQRFFVIVDVFDVLFNAAFIAKARFARLLNIEQF